MPLPMPPQGQQAPTGPQGPPQGASQGQAQPQPEQKIQMALMGLQKISELLQSLIGSPQQGNSPQQSGGSDPRAQLMAQLAQGQR